MRAKEWQLSLLPAAASLHSLFYSPPACNSELLAASDGQEFLESCSAFRSAGQGLHCRNLLHLGPVEPAW